MLERARLVVRRRAGRDHLLSLDLGPLDEAVIWSDATRGFSKARLDALAAFLEDGAGNTAPVARSVESPVPEAEG